MLAVITKGGLPLNPPIPGWGVGEAGFHSVGFTCCEARSLDPSREAALTFQAEDPVPQGIDNVLQGRLISDVEEVLVIGVTGDVFDFV